MVQGLAVDRAWGPLNVTTVGSGNTTVFFSSSNGELTALNVNSPAIYGYGPFGSWLEDGGGGEGGGGRGGVGGA